MENPLVPRSSEHRASHVPGTQELGHLGGKIPRAVAADCPLPWHSPAAKACICAPDPSVPSAAQTTLRGDLTWEPHSHLSTRPVDVCALQSWELCFCTSHTPESSLLPPPALLYCLDYCSSYSLVSLALLQAILHTAAPKILYHCKSDLASPLGSFLWLLLAFRIKSQSFEANKPTWSGLSPPL